MATTALSTSFLSLGRSLNRTRQPSSLLERSYHPSFFHPSPSCVPVRRPLIRTPLHSHQTRHTYSFSSKLLQPLITAAAPCPPPLPLPPARIDGQKGSPCIPKWVLNWMLENLRRGLAAPVAAAILVAFLFASSSALAASGGVMGGRSRSFSSSRSRSSSSFSSSRRSSSYSSSSSSSSSPAGDPEVELTARDCCVTFCIWLVIFLPEWGPYFMEHTNPTSFLVLQVGLLGTARSIQRDLDRIAMAADTSTPNGLAEVLKETAKALLRHPDYCLYAQSSSERDLFVGTAERRFERRAAEEKDKFDRVTLANVAGVTKREGRHGEQADAGVKEYIVVTILATVSGWTGLPAVDSAKKLQEALQKLSSIRTEDLLAVRVLWTPQEKKDVLLRSDVIRDYPHLIPL